MRNLLRRLRRRCRYVIVDEQALADLRELAVVGAAYEIMEAEERRWLNLDAGDG
jgi:hypothetical protein